MSGSEPSLIAECPSCQTRFRVTEQQLAVADGRVRCGACLAVFDGRGAMGTGTGALPVGEDPIGVLLDTERPADGASAQPDATPAAAEEHAVELATTGPDRPSHPVALAAAIAVGLAFLLAGVLTVQYDVLVQHPVWREAYEIVGVDVPRFKALDAIRVANRSVDERRGAPADLIVRLDLTNTAPRDQRFPTLAVRFHGDDGALLTDAQRVEPVDYLPSRTHSRRMMPNSAATVVLRLDDPGPDAQLHGFDAVRRPPAVVSHFGG